MTHHRHRFVNSGQRRWAVAAGCLVVLFLLALPDGRAQPTPQDLPALTAKVRHCVVNISSTQVVEVGQGMPFMGRRSPMEEFFGKEFFERFFGGMPPARRETTALGSGFIISADGLILTNTHVVARAEEIKVRLEDEKEYDAAVVGTDPQTDLALIRVTPDENFPAPAELGDSDALKVGATVMAMGNPFGLGHTVTSGIVSAKGRIIGAGPYDDFLQTDAAINPGNSGGPLFNLAGEVVGINTAIVAQAQGIGFAIPINMAVDLLPQLKTGKIVRGWLGVMIQNVTPSLADALGLQSSKGVLISDTVSGGPADTAGLKRGDVILRLDGKPVKNAHALSGKVAGIAPETTVDVAIVRNGSEKTIPVTLGTKPTEQTAQKQPGTEPDKKWGLTVQELTPALAERLGYDRDEQGIVVVEVEPMSPAAEAGLRPGDLIKEANRRDIATMQDFVAAVRKAEDADRLLLLVRRGEGAFYSVLQSG
jgi:serine protease Do